MEKKQDLLAELNKTENGKSLLREVEPIEIPHKGYESPITLFQMDNYINDLQKEINAQEEKYIMQSIVSMGIDVDKNELIKALQYDREQYEKGYKDGKEELQAKIDKAIEELRKEIEENHLNVIDYADGEWIVKDFVYGAIERIKRNIGE